jgi:hypothetical protein
MHVVQKKIGPNYLLWSALKVPPSDFNHVSGLVQIGQIDNMGQYEGGMWQRKSDIITSSLADYVFFFLFW